MYRGTLRYPGWCETWQKFVELGLLDLTEREDLAGMTYRQLLAQLIGCPETSDLRRDLAVHLNLPEDSPVLDRFEWLGLFSDAPLPPQRTILDVLAVRMQEKLQYAPGERDMVVLLHDFVAEYPDRRERIRSWLVDFGIPYGDTAMARTVGLPAAIATRLILQGVIRLTGVHIPVRPEIYQLVLAELEERGIRVEERLE